MNSYTVGTEVIVSLSLLDTAGAPLVATVLSYTVLDEDGETIVAATSITPVVDAANTSITIPAISNGLGGKAIGMRQVVLTITTASGTIVREDFYLIRGSTLLIFLDNTFQTWPQSQMQALTMGSIFNFKAAERDAQEAAMIEAFYRITRFSYTFSQDYEIMNSVGGFPGASDSWCISTSDWEEMTEDTYLAFPERFRRALAMAQLMEADDIMAFGRPEDKRRSGLLSETVGESSMMFRSGKPIDHGICLGAMKLLGPFLFRSRVVARA